MGGSDARTFHRESEAKLPYRPKRIKGSRGRMRTCRAFLPLFTSGLALYLRRVPPRSPLVPAPPPSSPPPRLRTERHDRLYRPLILTTLAASLGVLILAFRLWPVEDRAPTPLYVATPQERIPMELIEPTAQAPRTAPPPPPTLPPVEVPNDVPIPELEIDFETLDTSPSVDVTLPDAPPGPVETEGSPDVRPTFVERADRRPQTISPVLPDYPREAERRGIRARVRLRLRIDERGRLKEVEIVDRFLLDKKDREERVAEIGYGVEQAVLDAVHRTRFRPGRHDGRPVETYTTMTLGVGI